jgi:hypothetical protein
MLFLGSNYKFPQPRKGFFAKYLYNKHNNITMAAYFLTEAYQSVYKQSLTEDFNDNLRFVDYMLDEDIQAVIESLIWEFQDYGCSLQEAFDTVYQCASPEVITESYQVISEARMTPAQLAQRQKFKEKQAADTKATTAAKEANQRTARRAARVQGAIKTVKAAWDGAKAGFGMAKKALSPVASTMNQARKEGQAKLGGLLRAGANLVGRVGRAASAAKYELSGAGERQRNLQSDFRRNVSRVNKAAAAGEREAYGREVAAQLRAPAAPKAKPEARRTPPALPPARETTPARTTTSARKAAAAERLRAAMAGSGPSGVSFAGPGGVSKPQTAKGKQQTAMRAASGVKRSARKAPKQINASYEYLLDTILEDLIAEGYANDVDGALYIIENLSENTLFDITQEYLAE